MRRPEAVASQARNGVAEGASAQFRGSAGTAGDFRRPVADGLHAAADAIAQGSQRLWSARRISEAVADAGHGVAEGLESSASYLESHDARRMLADALGLARRYPVQAALVVGAAGFLAGWLLRAATARRHPLQASRRHRRGQKSRV